jgi:hypothetical protein
MDVVIDAPWRVQFRAGGPNYVPILVFFPETKAGWRKVKIQSIRISELGSQGLSLLYEDTASSKPIVGESTTSSFTGRGMRVVNGFGAVSEDLDIVRSSVPDGDPMAAFAVSTIDDGNRGWHTVFRLPVPEACLAGGVGRVTLLVQVEYQRLDEADDRVLAIKRRLDVFVDERPLPTFPGWWSYDAHVHTLAEFSTDLSYKAIRKAFGGPIQMLRECARAVGLIDDLAGFKDSVITTDHNTFFSDREFVRYGPTTVGIGPGGAEISRPELTPYFVDLAGQPVPHGQREFENYMDLFGITFGEEVTLAKSGGWMDYVSGTLGSHLLTYSTRHFMGPFHGGRFFVFRDEPNPNSIEHVLSLMATDPHFPRGFCYAAHPFSASRIDRKFLDRWNEDQVETAIKGAFIRKRDGKEIGFVFKGFELWNEKMTRNFATTTIDPARVEQLLEDPTQEPAWRKGNPNWDEGLHYGLMRFHQAICDSLSYPSGSDASRRFIRKFYVAAGTDAHGDFNRNSDMLARGLASLPVQVLRFLKVFSVSDNAFGKLRTVVDATGSGLAGARVAERALDALARGQSTLSDGPVLDFALDSSAWFDGARRRWHAHAAFEDADGQIGGDGDMDGGRTMLVAHGGAEALLRYRAATSPTFGGELAAIELYRDEAGGKAKLVKVQRNTGPAVVLAATARLTPGGPAGGGPAAGARDPAGWRTVRVRDVIRQEDGAPGGGGGPLRMLCAVSLGGFTRREVTPPYDHRAYTNPIWVVPVQLALTGPSTAGPLPAGSVVATLKFPLSMSAAECDARIVPLDAQGASMGEGSPMVPHPNGGSRDNPRTGIAGSMLSLVNAADVPAAATGGGPQRYGLHVAGLSDIHGNRLNTVAWRLAMTAQGLVTAPAP